MGPTAYVKTLWRSGCGHVGRIMFDGGWPVNRQIVATGWRVGLTMTSEGLLAIALSLIAFKNGETCWYTPNILPSPPRAIYSAHGYISSPLFSRDSVGAECRLLGNYETSGQSVLERTLVTLNTEP